MAFTVEDGTGKPDANSYATAEEADEYFSERGVTAWAGAAEVKQAALIKATDYIDGRFSERFIGSKNTVTQALCWPRKDAADFATNELPRNLKRACMEYAVRGLTASLAPDPKVDASGLVMVATKKKVGPIETEFAPVQTGLGASPMLFRPYPAADMLLRGLVLSGRVVIRG